MKKIVCTCFLISFCLIVFTGCGKDNKQTANSASVVASSDTGKTAVTQDDTSLNDEETKPEESKPEETKQELPKPEEDSNGLILPLTVNDSGKVMIQTVSKNKSYPFNTYIITSVSGDTIVLDPTQMPTPNAVDLNPIAIISTHEHADHVDPSYASKYPDAKIVKYTEEDFEVGDFHIYTIPSTHNEGGEFNNVITVVEVDGLRIAHMGDIGQESLTDDQLDKLGKIDIAFMQFENSYSNIDLNNQRGFKVIEQLNPTIVIPTHYTEKTVPVMEEKYGEMTDVMNVFTISADELPEKSLTLYHILNEHKYR